MQTTRITMTIIDAYGHQYQFKVAWHDYVMRPWLLDGNMNLQEEVEMI
jgi:hypothetical protein